MSGARIAGLAPQRAPFEVRHDFCPGIYARTTFLPADTVAGARSHLTQHFFVLVKGSCTVIDSSGERLFIEAPHMGIVMPGTSHALHVHEDSIYTSFHATDLTDIEEIERTIVAQTFGPLN